MALILGLDIAITTGWAIYDTDKTPSAIVSGSFRAGGKDADLTERLLEIRRQVPKLIREYRPSFAAIEEPLTVIPRYKKKPRKGLIDEPKPKSIDGGKVFILLRKGMNVQQIASHLDATADDIISAIQPAGMNPKAMMVLSELAGGATVAVQGHNVPCVQVRAQTWQTVIPSNIKAQFRGEGATKKWVKAYCDALRIVSPNMDSRDACIIALWAAGHWQALKLVQRTREAA